MRRKIFWMPLWVYLALAALAIVYAWYKGTFDPAHSEFAGMPLIVLGLPWSFMFHNWDPKMLASAYNNSILVESVFIGLNAAILGLGAAIISARSGRTQKT